MDLSNENEIEVVYAQQDIAEDPLQLFEEAASTTATAAAPAPDESAEEAAYMEYLRRHVPYWTREPVWTDWFDKNNPQASIDEDTKRKYDLGEQFIADINERYEGPQLNWLLVSLEHHGYWWKRKTFVSGRSPTQLSIFDSPWRKLAARPG